MSEPKPNHCASTVALLTALVRNEDGSYALDEALFKEFKVQMDKDLRGPEMKKALTEFVNVANYVGHDLEQPELTQRLVDEIENVIQPDHLELLQGVLKHQSEERLEGAREGLEKLTGGPNKNEPEIKAREKIDLTLPKGSFKG